MNDYISQTELAKITGTASCNLRRNVRILLKMVLNHGYTLNKNIAEKMDKGAMRYLK